MIARAAAPLPAGEIAARQPSTPCMTRSMGSGTPITPVLAIRTSSSGMFRPPATRRAVSRAS